MPKNDEAAYKRAGSLWFREKTEEDGTRRKYLAGQVQLEVDGKLVTANVTIFANRSKMNPRQPDSFLYLELLEPSTDEKIPVNEKWDIDF